MGVTEDQAGTLLGGSASDQTGQSQSPVFQGPSSADGSSDQANIQSLSTVVRTARDERLDFAVFSNSRFPGCNGTFLAGVAQLGVNDDDGGDARQVRRRARS